MKILIASIDLNEYTFLPFLIIFHLLLVPKIACSEVKTQNFGGFPNFNISVDILASLAEQLNHIQPLESKNAAVEAKRQLAEMSRKWANIAKLVFLQKAKEVVQITKQAQDAQILSLKTGSVSTRLKSAVFAARSVFDAAVDRYMTLNNLATAADIHSSAATLTLDHFLKILSVREKWAWEEQERARRLSDQLQSILEDLKKTVRLAKDATEDATRAQTDSQTLFLPFYKK